MADELLDAHIRILRELPDGCWFTSAALRPSINAVMVELDRIKGELEGAVLSASYYQSGIESWHSREMDVLTTWKPIVDAAKALAAGYDEESGEPVDLDLVAAVVRAVKGANE